MRQVLLTRNPLRIVASTMMVLLLTGCGQKGDLYLPEAAQLLNIVVF